MHSTTLLSSIILSAVALAAPSAPRSDDSSIDSVLPPVVPVNTRAADPELITKLMTAPTQRQRANLLDQPGDFVFDFTDLSLNVVVKGRLVTNFVIENGVEPIENTMSLYQMSVFPKGAIHQEYYPDCEDTVFVAGFNDPDPGVEQVAQAFFSLNPEVVSATLGGVTTLDGKDIASFREHIPDNVALGIEACLNKCGLKRNAKRDDFFLN
ncbi:hypothetical protein BN1708_014535 [Verticillium longisporum]|uniref:Cupin type-1 domain-containing protein n=1 Tax=Verticillium longisporum TaxID=100787 RepID=A0A0G4LWM9_VERLO|nr:hypothetical protein BN1708_014535 [Verticillium longisporum]